MLFLAFHTLFCEIAYLRDIDVKLSGHISDVNLDDPAKIATLACLEVAFPKIIFSEFWSVIKRNKVGSWYLRAGYGTLIFVPSTLDSILYQT